MIIGSGPAGPRRRDGVAARAIGADARGATYAWFNPTGHLVVDGR